MYIGVLENTIKFAPDFNPGPLHSVYYFLFHVHKKGIIYPKYCTQQILLILAGDIALNPGPVKTPCGSCSRSVARTHKVIQCVTSCTCGGLPHQKIRPFRILTHNGSVSSAIYSDLPTIRKMSPCKTDPHKPYLYSKTEV